MVKMESKDSGIWLMNSYRMYFALLLMLAFGAAQLVPAATLSVMNYGAKGDGATDDTAAIQSAIDACAAQGRGIVNVPAHSYMFKGHLTLKATVTLQGEWNHAMPLVNGSVLLATEGAGNAGGTPFITMEITSTLKGLKIFYPRQTITNPPVAYPWTIRNSGTDIAIIDVMMINPYQAVDFGTNPSGRHFIRNLYGQPLYRGIYIDNCMDVVRMENVHF